MNTLVTPGVKARTEQRHKPGILKAILIGPLPVIFELGLILGLIVRCVDIMHTSGKAGVHDRQILIGQRKVDDQRGLDRFDQQSERGDFFGVDLIRIHGYAGALFDRRGNRITFRFCAARKADVRENIGVHRHLVHRDRSDAACADYQNPAHLLRPSTKIRYGDGI